MSKSRDGQLATMAPPKGTEVDVEEIGWYLRTAFGKGSVKGSIFIS